MHPLLRFWVTTIALVAGVGALVYLTLSFVFPEAVLFATIGHVERLAAVGVVVLALGVVVWNATASGEVVSVQGGPGER